jgi:hypothetical protein
MEAWLVSHISTLHETTTKLQVPCCWSELILVCRTFAAVGHIFSGRAPAQPSHEGGPWCCASSQLFLSYARFQLQQALLQTLGAGQPLHPSVGHNLWSRGCLVYLHLQRQTSAYRKHWKRQAAAAVAVAKADLLPQTLQQRRSPLGRPAGLQHAPADAGNGVKGGRASDSGEDLESLRVPSQLVRPYFCPAVMML